MRRVALTLFIIIASWYTLSAQSLLDTFEKNIAQLGVYQVKFTVEIDGYKMAGSYIVDGDDFYAAMEGVEIFVSQGVKHEVNSSTREVTIDSAANLGSDILSNPAKGFEVLKEQYSIAQTDVDGLSAIQLTPKSGGERIIVVADSAGTLPRKIVYSDSGAELTITFTAISATNAPLPRFEATKYAGYEVIDMR